LGPSGFEVPPKASRLRGGAQNSEGPNHETFAQIQNNPYFHFFLHLCHQVALKAGRFLMSLVSSISFCAFVMSCPKAGRLDEDRACEVSIFVFVEACVCKCH